MPYCAGKNVIYPKFPTRLERRLLDLPYIDYSEDWAIPSFDEVNPITNSRGVGASPPREAVPAYRLPPGQGPHPFRDAVAMALGAWCLIVLTALIFMAWAAL